MPVSKKRQPRQDDEATTAAKAADLLGARLVGKVEIRSLATVQPNGWNPNQVPANVMESIRHGFKTDGWLVSQALLVWASDETGAARNLIIDGEHRWRAAVDVGLEKGPMVLLTNLRETDAKALTVKLNQKRGDWNMEALAALVKEIQFEIGEDDIALDLGFTDEEAMRLIAFAAEEIPAVTTEEAPVDGQPPNELSSSGSGVRSAQFFYSPDEHAELSRLIPLASKQLGTENPSDTVLAAIRKVVNESTTAEQA